MLRPLTNCNWQNNSAEILTSLIGLRLTAGNGLFPAVSKQGEVNWATDIK